MPRLVAGSVAHAPTNPTPHGVAGEPIFVARPGGEQEDDGVLLTVVLAGGLAARSGWRVGPAL